MNIKADEITYAKPQRLYLVNDHYTFVLKSDKSTCSESGISLLMDVALRLVYCTMHFCHLGFAVLSIAERVHSEETNTQGAGFV
jgi:hypothetical protein